ncbi:MAG: PKD domain-containing protein [Candidatus Aminicenantes bacterium]|nr:PKD domain-containing protein [Candidatus Aminicenantes bacterium]
MKKALGITVLFLICSFSLSAQTNLSQSRVWSELPFVIAMPNGEIMVAWTEGSFNEEGIIMYRTYSDSSGWSNTKVAAYPVSGSAAFPQLAVDSSGNVHMTYHDGDGSSNREIYYKKYVNGSWSGGEMVGYSPGLNSSWPRIDVEGNRIYILWCHNYTPPGVVQHQLDIVMMEKEDGGQWPESYQNVSKLSDSVSVHPFIKVKDGNVFAAWMDDNHSRDNWNLYYNERINGSWGDSVRLNPGGNQYIPAMAVDDNGDIHLIYSGKNNPIYYQKKTSQGWTSPAIISSGSTSVTTMIYLKYKHGFLHGVWRQSEGEGDYIFYAKGNIDGQWETPVRVSNGGQSEYTVCDVDTQGRVHVVYSDIGTGGYRDIFHTIAGQTTASPVALFSATPSQGAPPLSVYLDASASYDPDGQITDHSWVFGDGTTGSGEITSHTYTQVGTYTIQLTVTDNEKNTSRTTKKITAGTPPVASFTATPPTGPSPLTVRFDASASYTSNGSIASYHWDFGDGTSGSGITTTHIYTNISTRTATLTVKDSNGLESSATTTIQISDKIVASFTANPPKGVPPLKVIFDASLSKPTNGASIVSYEWDFGDGKSANGKIVNNTYLYGGKYTTTLKITDNQGYIASTTKIISVFHKPIALFSISPEQGATPLEVSFDGSLSSDQDGQIVLYSWDFGDGHFKEGKRVTHTYTKGGIWTVTLRVYDNDKNYDVKTAQIEAREKPYPPTGVSLNCVDTSGLFISACTNTISWAANPMNASFNILKYRIYRKAEEDGSYALLKEVDSITFSYTDAIPSYEKSLPQYAYAVSALDDNNRESDMAVSVPQTKNSSIKSEKRKITILK